VPLESNHKLTPQKEEMAVRRYPYGGSDMACRSVTRKRHINYNGVVVFSVPSVPRCYKQDSQWSGVSSVNRELLS
jgi:hypothetical protein